MNTNTDAKTSLLAALATVTSIIGVPDYGDVRIKQLSVAESDAIRADLKKSADEAPSEFGLRLLVASVVNEAGAPMFCADDLPALRSASGRKVDELMKAVLTANGYGTGDVAKN